MRCNICNKELSASEIVFNKELDAFEPCSVCLDVIMDTAFSQGFNKPDDEEVSDEVGDKYGDGIVETLEEDEEEIPFNDCFVSSHAYE